MADEPDNLVLTMLRRIDAKVDRLVEDVKDLKVRMTHVEEGLAGVNRRLDRLDDRVERIEKRLDLVDSPYGGVRE
jgi:predicted nuclease with TOPRIM domain